MNRAGHNGRAREGLVYHPGGFPRILITMRSTWLILALAMATSGCGIIYKAPIHQGNLLDERNVSQLQVGMNRRQVISLLGSPVIADPFHQSRWDYVASQKRKGKDAEIKRFAVFFDGDSLTRWEGDYFPEQNQALWAEMQRFGNLPKSRDEKRRR
jgi:outer membrane protein assembly factor BamE